jgi:hypothetical protein
MWKKYLLAGVEFLKYCTSACVLPWAIHVLYISFYGVINKLVHRNGFRGRQD